MLDVGKLVQETLKKHIGVLRCLQSWKQNGNVSK